MFSCTHISLHTKKINHVLQLSFAYITEYEINLEQYYGFSVSKLTGVRQIELKWNHP